MCLCSRDRRDFKKEARRLREAFDHSCIVNIIGLTFGLGKDAMILELMIFGHVLHFLKDYTGKVCRFYIF